MNSESESLRPAQPVAGTSATQSIEAEPQTLNPTLQFDRRSDAGTGTDGLRDDEATLRLSPDAHVLYFGNYELLDEIARGGMGVVYKARQVKLNRIVAVKMILSGHLASAQEVRRFRVEAEAAAQLQHPNIVAIHEVGEYQNQHYFSMDYIGGTSLSVLLRTNPLPSQQAAWYVKMIAEAIHYAHSKGVLHRDLKPSNVLMQRAEEQGLKGKGKGAGQKSSGAVAHWWSWSCPLAPALRGRG